MFMRSGKNALYVLPYSHIAIAAVAHIGNCCVLALKSFHISNQQTHVETSRNPVPTTANHSFTGNHRTLSQRPCVAALREIPPFDQTPSKAHLERNPL